MYSLYKNVFHQSILTKFTELWKQAIFNQSEKVQNSRLAIGESMFNEQFIIKPYDLFVTSKNETLEFTNSPIHEFKVLHRDAESILKPQFKSVLFLIFYFKKHLSLAFSF